VVNTRRKNIVILIDCWDYTNIDNKNSAIVQQTNIQQNLRQKMCQNICDFISNNTIDLIVDATHEYEIHPLLFDVIQRKNFIAIKKISEFEHYVFEKYDSVNLYYTGLYWNMCTKDREIGWKNINNYVNLKNLDYRILFKDGTILASENEGLECWPDFDNDFFTLSHKISETTWELIREKQ